MSLNKDDDLKNLADQLTNNWSNSSKNKTSKNNSVSYLFFTAILAWVLSISIGSALFMLFWNISLPEITSKAPSLSYLQCIGLIGACKVFLANSLPVWNEKSATK